jgi:hypothetical protein
LGGFYFLGSFNFQLASSLCYSHIFKYFKEQKMQHYALGMVFLLLFFSGCSLQKLAIKSATPIFSNGVEALFEETDLPLAEQAIASNLKLLEGLYKSNPKNKDVLLLLTQGYASYSLGFVEDDSLERAKLFYLRARDYGFKLLQTTSAFKDSIPLREQLYVERLNRLKEKDVPAIFWTAFAWGGWISLSKDDPQAIFDLGKVKAMMNKVIELDEGFFYGSAHLFFGTISGALPKILGGDPEKAKQHFERCLALSKDKFILAYVYLAKYYAQPLLDEKLFDQYLQRVDEASLQILPENKLITAIAKEKARLLKGKKEELF